MSSPEEFDSLETLHHVHASDVDVLVHLAAATGGRDEDAAIRVNVLGTLRLLRHLIDGGCRKFILASSIASTGCLDANFLPLALPIDDDHPCLARDAYGVSKALMETTAAYCQRRDPQCDFVVLRIGPVVDSSEPTALPVRERVVRPFVELARVDVADVVRALVSATEAPETPRFELVNLVGPDSSCVEPVADVLRASLGERIGALDLSHYESPGQEHAPIYELEKLQEVLRYSPTHRNRTS